MIPISPQRASVPIAICAQTIKKHPVQHETEVGCLINGRLMIQAASGGRLRAPTTDERTEWKRAAPEGAPTAASAHGYFIQPDLPLSADITFIGKRGNQIELGNKIVVQPGWLTKAVPPGTFSMAIPHVLEGWLPDQRHFALYGREQNSGANFSSRTIVDAATGRIIPFNGWVDATMYRGIVPVGNNTNAGLYSEILGFKLVPLKDSTGQVVMEKSFDPGPSRTRYAIVRLPKLLSAYHGLNTSGGSIPLTVSGSPFIYRYLEGGQGTSGTIAQFIISRDGRWALCTQDERGSILFSMVTGRGRLIPDKSARFVEPLTAEERSETDND